MEEEIVIDRVPNLELAEWHFELSHGSTAVGLKSRILEEITSKNMAPYYVSFCHDLKIPVDEELLGKMKAANEAELKKLDEKIKDAEENLGESEVREAYLARASYFATIGDKENALSAYRVTIEKTVGVGQRLDLVFTIIRIGFFFHDADVVSRNIEKAKTMVEEGGDWERRNRLKSYEGAYLMSIRDFKKAATLFLDTLATFTSYELCSYKQFIYYSIILAVVAKDRAVIRQKLMHAPEVLSVVGEMPHVKDLMNSLYQCNYRVFFLALAEITEQIRTDRFLSVHRRYLTRELRLVAYTQFLESYRSVTLDSVAQTFGVTPQFIDHELSRFVASGRLNCKIDKVAGIVETTRPDTKNAQYQSTIKEGDILLNRIQKLSRVINL
eukprot:TRINITY_DN6679_c0_g1_i1.p1 TRINITY_DN6679_c0_g1~~TRINITY_DN6679_c0_g1_i1.p1  ORF type:complete len:384 (-),score=85.69 TRINITY_DN6679_c0_g1_i1:198-1349(-)